MVDTNNTAHIKPLITSIVAPLMNKVKMSMLNAKKNRILAGKLEGTIALLAEQLLPHFLAENSGSYE